MGSKLMAVDQFYFIQFSHFKYLRIAQVQSYFEK